MRMTIRSHPRLFFYYFSRKRLAIDVCVVQYTNNPHLHISCAILLQVQRLRGDDVASDFAQRRLEFLLELLAAHHLSRLGDLAEQFFQTSEQTNQAAFVDICHFAVGDVSTYVKQNGLRVLAGENLTK